MKREYTKNAIKAVAKVMLAFVVGLVFCFLITLCAGCKSTKYVEVEVPKIVEVEVPKIVTQTNTEYHTDIVRDTLIRRDSVFIYQKGDTIYHERWHEVHNVNRYYVADTIHDSIPIVVQVTKEVPVEVVRKEQVEVEKPLTKWQSFKMSAGGFLLSIVGVGLVVLIILAVRKLRNMTKF